MAKQKVEMCLDIQKWVNNITRTTQYGLLVPTEKFAFKYENVPFGTAGTSSEINPAARLLLEACLLAMISHWLWASSDGGSTGSETEVQTPGLNGAGSVDVWLTCVPKPTTSSEVVIRFASPFESEAGKWLTEREFFAMGAGVCDGPLDNPPDKLAKGQLRVNNCSST
jgi:hypothetical protein